MALPSGAITPNIPGANMPNIHTAEIRLRFGENEPPKPMRPRTFNEGAMYGISRREVDVAGKGGHWKVALSRRGKMYAKNFYDTSEGGKEEAFAAASRYRDELLSSTTPRTIMERCQLHRSNNTSGVPGVRLVKKKGHPYAWEARIKIHGKEKSQRFPIGRYGDEGAFELAVKARHELLKQVEEGYCVYSPVAKELYAVGKRDAA